MKNAAKFAPVLKALAAKLGKNHPIEPYFGDDVKPKPLAAVVLGALRYDAAESKAAASMAAIEDEFVDLNDLRACTDLELVDLLSDQYTEAESDQRASLIHDALSQIFDIEGRLTLDRVVGLSRREIRPAMRRAIIGDHDEPAADLAYVEAHVALFASDFGVLPIDEAARQLLLKHKAIDADATLAETAKFCEQNLKVDDCRTIFAAVRASS